MNKFSIVVDILNDKEKSEINGVMRYGLLCVGEEAMQLNCLLIISFGRQHISVALLLRMRETGSRN